MKHSKKNEKKARPTAVKITQNRTNGKQQQRRRKEKRSHHTISKAKKKLQKKQRQARRAATDRQKRRMRGIDENMVHEVCRAAFKGILHHKQIASIALVTLGVVYAVKMTIHEIGAAMVRARNKGIPKHAIKQVDRYMSNKKIGPVDVRRGLVWYVVGNLKHIDVTMDWTDFDKDDQTTLVISLVQKHGRATPLVWLNERKSELEGRRSLHEKTAVQELRSSLPDDVTVTLMADRGFGDTKLFDYLQEIPGFDFVIRFKKGYIFETAEYSGKVQDVVPRNGRIRVLRDALLTGDKRGPYTLVLVKARKMKDPWCLATSLDTVDGHDIVRKYGYRFECEEAFRDLKDWRFGLALKYTKIGNELRRDRLLFAFALSAFLLTLVGLVSERLGLDRLLRANTSKNRTHSLFRQGREIVRGALSDVFLERQLFKEVKRLLSVACSKGLCHAFS